MVSLIITIIILLILAGISIATLTGENGLITKAIEAREKTEIAEIEEQIRLAQLGAKLKKEGGDITIEDLLDELGKQGVDFEREDEKTIIVDGKYVYEFEEEDGDIKWNPAGTVANPKPRIISAEIVDKTETSIKVKVTVVRNGKGDLSYSIQEENGEYQEIARSKISTNEKTEDEYTFVLDPSKIVAIKVEAIAENGETASKEISLSNLPILSEDGNKNITFSYSVDGKIIHETDWTQGPILVTVKLSSELKGYTLQDTISNPDIESNWKEYPTSGIEIKENGTIYFRLKDDKTGETGIKYRKKISNIDKTIPVISQLATSKTSYSITLQGTVVESDSGIAKCEFSKDGGTTWVTPDKATDTNYTFDNLEQDKTYQLQMKVTDKAGNVSEIKSTSATTATVPTGTASIKFSYKPSEWTNGNVIVTITNTQGGNYRIQYTKQDPEVESNWADYTDGEEILFEQNGPIYARLRDEKHAGTHATGNVTNIDKLPPNAFTASTLTATSTENSITVRASTTDPKDANNYAGSGNIQYRFKIGDGSYSSYQTSGNYTFNSSTGHTLTKNTNYTITVEAKDAVGFTTTGTVTIKTKNTYTVTYNANGGSGAPSSQTKIEGTNLTLSGIRPTRSGYSFKGWGTSSSATTASYQPYGIYSTDANLNLFAVWGETQKLVFSGPRNKTSVGTGTGAVSVSVSLPSSCRIFFTYSMSGSKGASANLTCGGTTIWSIGFGSTNINADKDPEKDGIVCGPGTATIACGGTNGTTPGSGSYGILKVLDENTGEEFELQFTE